jgi:hypothetical protein
MKGATRILYADVNQLKELHAHQGNLRLKERVQTGVATELLATPWRGSWRHRCMQQRLAHDLCPTPR